MNWVLFAQVFADVTITLLLMIVVHEAGHAWAFKRVTGKSPILRLSWRGFKVGRPEDYEVLSEEQYRAIIIGGLIIGIIPLALIMHWLPSEDLIFLITSLYLFGCKEDLLYLIQSYKRTEAKK